MKKVIFYFAVLIFASACKKSTTPTVHNGITGKWKVSAYLADPGDGSGDWQPADPSVPGYLEFKENGSLIITPLSLNNFDHYELTSDSTLNFKKGSASFQRRYRLSTTLLTITGGCDEACGTWYIPVQ